MATFPTAYPVDFGSTYLNEYYPGNQGPFEIGGALYIVGNEWYIPGSTATFTIGVYKSTDGGITWITQDRAGTQVINGMNAFWQPGMTKILICYVDFTSGELCFVYYDTTTDTYEAPVTGSGVTPVNSILGGNLVMLPVTLSTGEVVIIYAATGVPAFQLYFISYASGTWSAATLIDSTGDGQLNGFTLDSHDRFHFIRTNRATVQLIYNAIVGGALTGDQQIGSGNGTVTQLIPGAGIYDPVLDRISMPLRTPAPGSGSFYLVRGSPSAAPVLSIETVASTSEVVGWNIIDGPNYQIVGGVERFIVNSSYLGGTYGEYIRILYWNKVGSAWLGPHVGWDSNANPTVPPAIGEIGDGNYSIGVVGGGTLLGIYFNAFVIPPLPPGYLIGCGAPMYFVSYVPVNDAETLMLACPINNVGNLGSLYSGTLIATGGTPPYTFKLTSAPAWLTVDPSTGVVSGFPPYAIGYSYIAEVIDANGMTAFAECTIRIRPPAGPGGANPCAGVTPKETDVHFELQRVYASMKPAPRIPVRGS